MYDLYFLRILMRERERETLEELRWRSYRARRRREGSGLSKKIAGRLRSAFLRFKTIDRSQQSGWQPATDNKGGYESWEKEFS